MNRTGILFMLIVTIPFVLSSCATVATEKPEQPSLLYSTARFKRYREPGNVGTEAARI